MCKVYRRTIDAKNSNGHKGNRANKIVYDFAIFESSVEFVDLHLFKRRCKGTELWGPKLTVCIVKKSIKEFFFWKSKGNSSLNDGEIGN
jgi:hypothetical protein